MRPVKEKGKEVENWQGEGKGKVKCSLEVLKVKELEEFS